MSLAPRSLGLAQQTDLCVKCGLCLPHCPTYLASRNENESPRGRLALIQGWAEGALQAGPALQAHLDHCLLCRACESACPAQVPYGEIMDGFRSQLTASERQNRPRRIVPSLICRLLSATKPLWLRRLLGRLANGGLVQRGARLLGWPELFLGIPDPKGQSLPDFGRHPAPKRPAGSAPEVQLFIGCSAEFFDTETVAASLAVLRHRGYQVDIPRGQGCCGALDQHAGDAPRARSRMQQNQSVFNGPLDRPVLGFSSGCGAQLREYPEQPGSLRHRFEDICEFLAKDAATRGRPLTPLTATAVLHTPCSLRHGLRQGQGAGKLLADIPGLRVLSLNSSHRCCGAAGRYLLDFPEAASGFLKPLIDQVESLAPHYLLTSNPGCAAHLRKGLKSRGLETIEVLHPISLLARQIQ